VRDSDAVRALSNRELIAEITAKVARLARAELELAKAEIRADAQAELTAVKSAALAALAVLLGVNMLLVAGVLALATSIPGWVAALVVGGALLVGGAVAGYIGWRRMVTNPLALTRQTLREDVRWVKERLA
jgi:protein-S-isoprenylcysteine O-methyltransferase Ste14